MWRWPTGQANGVSGEFLQLLQTEIAHLMSFAKDKSDSSSSTVIQRKRHIITKNLQLYLKTEKVFFIFLFFCFVFIFLKASFRIFLKGDLTMGVCFFIRICYRDVLQGRQVECVQDCWEHPLTKSYLLVLSCYHCGAVANVKIPVEKCQLKPLQKCMMAPIAWFCSTKVPMKWICIFLFYLFTWYHCLVWTTKGGGLKFWWILPILRTQPLA